MKKEESLALAKTQAASSLITATSSLLFDVEKFEHAQRVAKMLSTSTLVPEHFRNNLGNCVIALNYAERINADPFMVLQNMYVVKGHPGIEGKLVIAIVNQCGRFEPMEFEETVESCIAIAKEIKSGKILRGPTVNLQMVKDEGWYDKKGPDGSVKSNKWRTMPQIMFRYRAATFFARTYCPETLLGMKTLDELDDIIVDLKRHTNGTYTFPQLEEQKDIKEQVNQKLNYLKNSGQIKKDLEGEEEKELTEDEKAKAAQAKLEEKRKAEAEGKKDLGLTQCPPFLLLLAAKGRSRFEHDGKLNSTGEVFLKEYENKKSLITEAIEKAFPEEVGIAKERYAHALEIVNKKNEKELPDSPGTVKQGKRRSQFIDQCQDMQDKAGKVDVINPALIAFNYKDLWSVPETDFGTIKRAIEDQLDDMGIEV